ncbi:MAG: NAD(P)-dependent alcohol dehydrogenase [Gammaproteobacteria bacterium]|nr:NAD(P)-dependent alcohol dehydrogenase [Gammaproteobacteria bacterium]
MKSYQLAMGGGVDDLKTEEHAVPRPQTSEVLVRMRAAALNYRDLLLATGRYPRTQQASIVPLSDGAGEVVEVGPAVTRFRTGDRVAGIFMQSWLSGVMRDGDGDSALGGSRDGVLCEYRVFDEQGLVAIPAHLSFEEAATLPCAAVTAWHALFARKPLTLGQQVLILGTGGVAAFAMQLARAAGATAIVTSSSDDKLARMREFGASHGINYRATLEFSREVRRLTGGMGVDHVIETGGGGTLLQSIAATRRGGQIHLIGVIAPGAIDPIHILLASVGVQGIEVGSREMFEALNQSLALHRIHPIISRVFEFNEAQAAYRYFERAEHIGKVVIQIA